MIALRALLLLAVLAAGAGALEREVELVVPGEAEAALPVDALVDAEALRVRVGAWRDPADRVAWLELVLVCADERRFVVAEAIACEAGDTIVPLTASAWVGEGAPLGGDALAAVRAVVVRGYGGDGAAVTLRIAVEPAARPAPRFAAELVGGGLVERGAWRELRLRLLGDVRGERGELDLVAGDGGRIPCFLEQPGAVVDGRWRPRGACRWVARLRPDEDVAGRVPNWRDGRGEWRGAALPALAVGAHEPPPAALAPPFPFPTSPAWRGRATRAVAPGRFARDGERDHAACPAPILAWISGWTGFRGGAACAHAEAAALDALLAGGVAELDLLPQALFDEHGAFRFGLAPWHASQGGPWREPQDALAHDAPLAGLRAHARWVVARARAAPGLAGWRLGFTQPANAPAEVERLRALVGDLAALVAGCDGRPLLAFHPQAVDYGYTDPKGLWFGFESGVQGWRVGVTPPGGPSVAATGAPGSEGAASLPIPLDLAGRAGGAYVVVDASLVNLDRLELDARYDATGAATVYAWVTDEHHRWYQQRLGDVGGNGRWHTLGVDFSDGAAWQPSGHDHPWDGSQRRRIRLLGICAFAWGDDGRSADKTLRIDRVRRLGWPALVDEPALTIDERAVGGDVARWRPLSEDFALSLPAANPYDPDSADVVAEVEGPDGAKLRHPAYWAEPYRLDLVDGSERAVPIGDGGWHWRFTPRSPGAWRWRMVARVKWRDRWLETAGAWHAATVAAAGDGAAPPVRRAAKDPRWFETVDGAFWYPMGMNLRSPGDSRQDAVLAQVAKRPGQPAASADFERLGTRAYERWFAAMHANGGDFARVWMCPWWCGLEWRRDWDEFGGVGWYNQAAAARLDRVLALAAQDGVRVQLELQNHGMYSVHVDQQWDDNPYSRRRGGMCPTAADFFTSDEAWTAHVHELRYVLARWGWDTAMAMLVLSSEIEFTEAWEREAGGDEENGHSRATEAWLRRSAEWLRANDPLTRPVSVHFSHPWVGARIWKMPELDWGYSNAYTGFQDQMHRLGGPRGLDVALEFYLARHFPPWISGRPTLVGEWGGHWADNTSARLAGEWHHGLWIQACLPYAGNTGFWWWLWVDAAGAWGEMAGPARFARTLDPRGKDFRVMHARPARQDLAMVGMGCDDEHRYYAFARGADRDPAIRVAGDAGVITVEGGTPDAVWQVERWDCTAGQPSGTTTLTADASGLVQLPLGTVQRDAAWILRKRK